MTALAFKQATKPLLAQKLALISWPLMALATILSGIGVLALYSVAGGSFEPWALPQIYRLCFGFAIVFVVALIPLRYWHFASTPFFIFALALLGLSAFYGVSVKGAQRWLEFGSLRIQPSEIAKIALIMVLASYYETLDKQKLSRPLWVAIPAMIIALPALLVAMQPDLGTAVLIAVGGGIIMFLSGTHLLYFAIILLITAIGLVMIFLSRDTSWQILSDYQFNRVETFLDPSRDPFGAGYHITQSKIAIGSGGLEGRGFLQGTQSQLNFLPEKHTDFVFTTLAEEFGLIWCVIILGFYAVIIFLCTLSALRSKNRFGSLLSLGVGSTLFLYMSANIAMISGLIPVVGVPLPLISYGGSSLMVLMFGFGLVQCVNIHASRY